MSQKENLKNIAKYLMLLIMVVAVVTVGGWYIYKNTLFTGYLSLNYWFKLYVKTYLKELLLAISIIYMILVGIKNVDFIKKHMKKLTDNQKSYVFMLLFWAIGSLVIFGRYLFGDNYFVFTDAGLDTATQYYPMYVNVAKMLRTGEISVWNTFWGLGCDIMNGQEWFLDPFASITILIVAVFGENLIRYLILIMQIVKILLSILCCYKFLSYYKFECKTRAIAASIYGFCGYMMLWGQHYYFGTAFFYVVLMLWGVESFLEKTTSVKIIYVSCIIAAILIFSGYFGYMILLFGMIYTFFRLGYLIDDGKLVTYWRKLWPLMISVIIGIIMSGITLLPYGELLICGSERIGTEETFIDKLAIAWKERFSIEYYLSMLSRLMSNSGMGIQGIYQEYYEYPQLSFSLFNIVVLPQFLLEWFRKKDCKKNKILNLLVVLIVVFALFIPFASFMFSAFATITKRWTFILMPLFSLAYAYFIEKQLIEKKYSKILLVLSMICIYGLSFWGFKNFQIEYRSVNSIVIIFCAFFSICLIAWQKYDSILFMRLALVLIFAGTIYEGYVSNNYRTTYNNDLFNDTGVEKTVGIISELDEKDDSFYRIEKSYYDFSIMGDSLIEMYHPVVMYSSTMSRELTDFYNKIYHRLKNGSSDALFLNDAMKMPALTLLNVKYLLSKEELAYDNLSLIEKRDDVYIYRNDDSKSIGILYKKLMNEAQFESLDISDRNKYLSRYLIVDNEQYTENVNVENFSDEKFDNETTNFKMIKQTYFKGDVNVNQDNQWLFLSIPWRNGWNLYVDGVKTEIIHADYGFMAAKISRGEHTVELKYENPIYLYGLFVSMAGIMLLIAYGHIYGRRFT